MTLLLESPVERALRMDQAPGPRPGTPLLHAQGLQGVAAKQFVCAFAGEQHLDAIGPASFGKRQQCDMAGVPAIAFKMPDYPWPKFEKPVPVDRHPAQGHADM